MAGITVGPAVPAGGGVVAGWDLAGTAGPTTTGMAAPTMDAETVAGPTIEKAVALARTLQERAAALQSPGERRRQAQLDRLLQNPADKATLIRMTDEAFRARRPARAVEHLVHILRTQGIPRFFSPWQRAALAGFRAFGRWLPGVLLPLATRYMRRSASDVILPGERGPLVRTLRRRHGEGVRMNVNFLGEAILGEGDAKRRLQQYLAALEWPEIEVVSIKISTLYSQVSPLAREHTVAVLSERLERLFRAAAGQRFIRPNGTSTSKFVYLDMEEYRDKDLTAEAFVLTLDRPGMEQVRAGIALQSYIPDSFGTLLRILAWARRRVAAGGGRIAVRLVKGANMEMERFEASLRGWPQAPYTSKLQTDANYKRMLHEMLKPENLAAADAGIASHNLFDLAYGLVLAAERNVLDRVQFEMLEGMANHQRRALVELCPNVLVYAPACTKEDFVSGIGYLVRRLDENTGPDNFLRHAQRLEAGSTAWRKLEAGFRAAFDAIPATSVAPRRTQDRRSPPAPREADAAVCRGWQNLCNEPDTDFSLPQNGQWADEIVARWKPRCDVAAPDIPLVIAGEEWFDGRLAADCLDPSRPGVVVGRWRRATEADVARAAECAAADPDGWWTLPDDERFRLLGQAANEVRQARADLLGAAMANGGKTLSESDPEVSEAVDFLELYSHSARWWRQMPTLRARPVGAVVVVSPWNFPIATSCGGVSAALAAGNTVVLKPSSDAVLVAWELCHCFWRAGVPRQAAQFVPCPGSRAAPLLVNHPKIDAVILTGGTATARAMLQANPRLNLFAETGGKNATIVTAMADRDQAIKHVVHSAFSHGGQKCSATSLFCWRTKSTTTPTSAVRSATPPRASWSARPGTSRRGWAR